MAELSLYRRTLGTRGEVGSYDVAISLDSSSIVDGNRVITPLCMNRKEWDDEILKLLKQIEAIREQGREFLK